jgi:ubiquinone/menaquinone biosynthesis C-methylase UbiE
MTTDTKQKILRFLRATKLLAVVDKLLLFKSRLKNYKDNEIFMKEHPGFQYPPYELAYDAYNHCGIRLYYEGGLEQANFYVNTIRKFKKESGLVVCEWGCGPARIIRHIKPLDNGIAELIGTDYNADTIHWCNSRFPDINFIHNQFSPPLPLGQNSVDVLYCWSVFTHLSEPMHHAWIEEIMRVLKPGGLFIGSFHCDKVKYQLLPDELDQYMKGELVVRSKVKEGSKHFTAFHSDDFLKEKLLNKFAQVTKLEDISYIHTIWCATTHL